MQYLIWMYCSTWLVAPLHLLPHLTLSSGALLRSGGVEGGREGGKRERGPHKGELLKTVSPCRSRRMYASFLKLLNLILQFYGYKETICMMPAARTYVRTAYIYGTYRYTQDKLENDIRPQSFDSEKPRSQDYGPSITFQFIFCRD